MGILSTSCHHFMLTCWIPAVTIRPSGHQAMGPWRQRHLSYREKSSPPQPFDLLRASQWIRWSLKWFLSHSGTRTPSRFLPRAHNAVTSSSPESRIDQSSNAVTNICGRKLDVHVPSFRANDQARISSRWPAMLLLHLLNSFWIGPHFRAVELLVHPTVMFALERLWGGLSRARAVILKRQDISTIVASDSHPAGWTWRREQPNGMHYSSRSFDVVLCGRLLAASIFEFTVSR